MQYLNTFLSFNSSKLMKIHVHAQRIATRVMTSREIASYFAGRRTRTWDTLCIFDSAVTRHCNYGRPLALPALTIRLCDFRPGGRNCFLFLRAVHRARTHCRFE